jgi:hypothetical protein
VGVPVPDEEQQLGDRAGGARDDGVPGPLVDLADVADEVGDLPVGARGEA